MPQPSQRDNRTEDTFTDESAKATASHCLLDDPRPMDIGSRASRWVRGIWRPSPNDYPEDRCIERQIRGKAEFEHVPAPQPGSEEYARILRQARRDAAAGRAECQVRDFEDTKCEPLPYYGYRGEDGACHVTHDRNEAARNRVCYPQRR